LKTEITALLKKTPETVTEQDHQFYALNRTKISENKLLTANQYSKLKSLLTRSSKLNQMNKRRLQGGAETKEEGRPIPVMDVASSSTSEDYYSSEFTNLWNGVDTLGGGSLIWDLTVEWLKSVESANLKNVVKSCILFYEKPLKWLFHKKSADKAGEENSGVDAKLMQYLPTITEEQFQEAKTEFIAKNPGKNFRGDWNPEFKYLNLSMTKRAALLFLETAPSDTVDPTICKWFSAWSVYPSEITADHPKFANASQLTIEIRMNDIASFNLDKHKWLLHSETFEGFHTHLKV
jgi:hypothetical protein